MTTEQESRQAAAKTQPCSEPRRGRVRGALSLALLGTGVLFAGACSGPTAGGGGNSNPLDQTVLGTVHSFAVLGATTVTNTGPTTIDGNLGVDPGLAITGFPPGLVTGGTIHSGDGVALQAQTDTTTAYNALAGQALTSDLTGQDLGGLTLVAGVYRFSSSAQLTGALTLDAKGDPKAVFVFQIGSTLTTASNSSVVVINSAQECNIFWQVGSSATLGTTTAFKGSILALASITLDTGATLNGRALARTGAVTLDSNVISIPICATAVDAGIDAASGNRFDSGVVADGSVIIDASVPLDSAFDGSTTIGGRTDLGGGLTPCCGGFLCAGSCVDLKSDHGNCGACGNACGSDHFCSGGACTACSHVCNGACTDFSYDRANCGACGHACNTAERCDTGVCVKCPAVCGGACTDTAWDQFNCGACGHSCRVSEVCFNGVCQTCSNLCGGACTDLTSDRQNCGACGNACAPGASCSSGACVCL